MPVTITQQSTGNSFETKGNLIVKPSSYQKMTLMWWVWLVGLFWPVNSALVWTLASIGEREHSFRLTAICQFLGLDLTLVNTTNQQVGWKHEATDHWAATPQSSHLEARLICFLYHKKPNYFSRPHHWHLVTKTHEVMERKHKFPLDVSQLQPQ